MMEYRNGGLMEPAEPVLIDFYKPWGKLFSIDSFATQNRLDVESRCTIVNLNATLRK